MSKNLYNGKTMQDIVDNPEWQKLRESFLETWKTNAPQNIQKLRRFLGNTSSTTNEKLLIVYNYLTGSVFRIGVVKHDSIDELKEEVREEIKKRKEAGKIKVTKVAG